MSERFHETLEAAEAGARRAGARTSATMRQIQHAGRDAAGRLEQGGSMVAHELMEQAEHFAENLSRVPKYLDTKIAEIPSFGKFLWSVFVGARPWVYDRARKNLRRLRDHDVIVITALAMAYFFASPARSFLSILAPSMQQRDALLEYTSARHGQVVVMVNVISAVGKLVTGIVIDATDPRLFLFFIMSVSGLSVFLISTYRQVNQSATTSQQHFDYILALIAVNTFVHTGVWAALCKFGHDHFTPAQFGRVVTLFGIGGRLGVVFGNVVLGALVSAGLPWWEGTIAAASFIVFAAPILGVTYCYEHPSSNNAAVSPEEYEQTKYKRDAKAPAKEYVVMRRFECSRRRTREHVNHFKGAFYHWCKWWTHKDFVAICLANACIGICASSDGFEAFITLFAVNQLGFAPEQASGLTVCMPLGIVASLVFGGYYLEALPKSVRGNAVLLMLFAGALLVGGILALSGAVDAGKPAPAVAGFGALVFCLGYFFGYAYWVAIPTFAQAFGGRNGALSQQTVSLFGSAVAAIFASIAGALSPVSWTGLVGVVLGFAVAAFLFMAFFYYQRLVEKKTEVQLALEAVSTIRELAVKQSSGRLLQVADELEKTTALALSQEEECEVRPSDLIAEAAPWGEQVLEPEVLEAMPHAYEWFGERGASLIRAVNTRRVRKGIVVLAASAAAVVIVVMFVLYFVARSTPGFVFPFFEIGNGVITHNGTATTVVASFNGTKY